QRCEHDKINNTHNVWVRQRSKIVLPERSDNILNDSHGLSCGTTYMRLLYSSFYPLALIADATNADFSTLGVDKTVREYSLSLHITRYAQNLPINPQSDRQHFLNRYAVGSAYR